MYFVEQFIVPLKLSLNAFTQSFDLFFRIYSKRSLNLSLKACTQSFRSKCLLKTFAQILFSHSLHVKKKFEWTFECNFDRKLSLWAKVWVDARVDAFWTFR